MIESVNVCQLTFVKDGKYLSEDAKSQMELLLEIKSHLLDLDEEYKGTEYLADTTYEVNNIKYSTSRATFLRTSSALMEE